MQTMVTPAKKRARSGGVAAKRVHHTEGRALLVAAVERHGGTTVATAVGVTEGAIRFAARGSTSPKAAVREKLAELFGIPVEAWDRPALVTAPTPSPKVANRGARGPDGAAGGVTHADPRANAEETLRVLRKLLAEAEADAIPEIARAITQSSRLLAAMTGQFELTTPMILRSHAWRGVKAAIVEALAPLPGALQAVATALEVLDA